MVKFSNVNKDGKFKMFTNDITSPTMVKFHNAISTGEFSYFPKECYPFKFHLVKVTFVISSTVLLHSQMNIAMLFWFTSPVVKNHILFGLIQAKFQRLTCHTNRGGHRHLQIGRMLDIDLISEPPTPHPLPPDVCTQKVGICVARGAGSNS
jgi:hypothetical protein